MRLVAEPHMQRVRVGLGIDRDGAQAEPLRGARDAAGDLAAIGDQDGREHGQALAQGGPEGHRRAGRLSSGRQLLGGRIERQRRRSRGRLAAWRGGGRRVADAGAELVGGAAAGCGARAGGGGGAAAAAARRS